MFCISNLYSQNDTSWINTNKLQFTITQQYSNVQDNNIFLLDVAYLGRFNWYPDYTNFAFENTIKVDIVTNFLNKSGIKIYDNNLSTRHNLTYLLKDFDSSIISGIHNSFSVHYKHKLFSDSSLLPYPFTIIVTDGIQINNKNNSIHLLVAPLATRLQFDTNGITQHYGMTTRFDITSLKFNNIVLNSNAYVHSTYDMKTKKMEFDLSLTFKISDYLTSTFSTSIDFDDTWIINQKFGMMIVVRFYDVETIKRRRDKMKN